MPFVASKTELRPSEVWYQDADSPDLWHGDNGVIVNTAALEERGFYFNVLRVTPRSNLEPVDLVTDLADVVYL